MSLAKILALVALLLVILAVAGVSFPFLVPVAIGCLAVAVLVGA